MQTKDIDTTPTRPPVQFFMGAEDQQKLKALPWNVPLSDWPEHGIVPLSIRRGESRHPVIFVQIEGFSYAIKETTPGMAEREINNLRNIEHRGIPTLSGVGFVVVAAPPIRLEELGPGNLPQYMNGDRGYTVTVLAPRVIPHALLYRVRFTRRNKRRLLSAIAVLMVELHEHGVYWGDPSLANVLIRLDGKRILAILADAETAELFPDPVSEGLREEDLASFGESMAWQAEDLNQAKGGSEDEDTSTPVINDADFRYFERKYRLLRKEHSRLTHEPDIPPLLQAQNLLYSVNRLGFSLLGLSGRALQEVVTVMPGWYQDRIRDLLGISVPRIYARRFYTIILNHQAILSDQEGREVNLQEAAKDWYTRYHLPAILLLRQHLTSEQDPMQAYFGVMRKKWMMGRQAGHEVPMEEAMIAWAMEQTTTGNLGIVDPALIGTWWRNLEPVAKVLEPALIEHEKLEPLLSEEEQHLVSLPEPQFEQELSEILEHQLPDLGNSIEEEEMQ